MSKQVIPVPGLARPGAAFSTLIVTPPGPTFYVAGLLARGDDGEIVGKGDAGEQTRRILANLGRAAEAAGATLADIVRLDIYVTDIGMREAVNQVRRQVFATNPPVSTMLQVAAFTEPDALVEITAIGVVPAK